MSDDGSGQSEAARHEGYPLARSIFIYAIATFAAGFVFGVLRELVLIPIAGKTAGHWIEFPFMLLATWAAAVYARQRLIDPDRRSLLVLGIGGTMLLLLIESSFALYVVQMPLPAYLASFDVTAGALFPWGLLFMILAPQLTSLKRRNRDGKTT